MFNATSDFIPGDDPFPYLIPFLPPAISPHLSYYFFDNLHCSYPDITRYYAVIAWFQSVTPNEFWRYPGRHRAVCLLMDVCAASGISRVQLNSFGCWCDIAVAVFSISNHQRAHSLSLSLAPILGVLIWSYNWDISALIAKRMSEYTDVSRQRRVLIDSCRHTHVNQHISVTV